MTGWSEDAVSSLLRRVSSRRVEIQDIRVPAAASRRKKPRVVLDAVAR
jgi:hypothetical protein